MTRGNGLNARFTAYINGLQPMLRVPKMALFEAIINHENEQAKQRMQHITMCPVESD